MKTLALALATVALSVGVQTTAWASRTHETILHYLKTAPELGHHAVNNLHVLTRVGQYALVEYRDGTNSQMLVDLKETPGSWQIVCALSSRNPLFDDIPPEKPRAISSKMYQIQKQWYRDGETQHGKTYTRQHRWASEDTAQPRTLHDPAWEPYTYAEYGYTLQIPTGLLPLYDEDFKNGNVIFDSTNGKASLDLFRLKSLSVQACYRTLKSNFGSKPDIQYHRVSSGLILISGFSQDPEFGHIYMVAEAKRVRGKKVVWNGMSFFCPATEASFYKPAISQVAHQFSLL